MSSDNCVSKFAVRNDSVLWLVVEPGSKNLDECATLGVTGAWEDSDNIWNSVGVELNTGWFISEESPWLLTTISLQFLVDTGFEVGNTLDLSIVESGIESSSVKVLSLSKRSVNSWPSCSLTLVSLKSLTSWNGVNELVMGILVVSDS